MFYEIKNRFLGAFEGCGPKYLVIALQLYSVFSALMILMALYAIALRFKTGFPM